MSFVLDTSVSLAWCFQDQRTQANLSLLERLRETRGHVPALWPIETLNGLLTAERRRRITSSERSSLVHFMRDLPLMVDGEVADRAWQATILLAARHSLTAYDATYLELALRLGSPWHPPIQCLSPRQDNAASKYLPADRGVERLPRRA